MIRDKPLKYLKWFFTYVIAGYVLRHFNKVRYFADIAIDDDKASLVLMNHYSFHDGIILYDFNRKLSAKQLRIMVVEAQLKAFIILRFAGCFSVNKKSRNMIESLNYAAQLLRDPKNMLGIYPQGELYSMHLDRIRFEKGLSYILKKSQNVPIQIFLGVTLLDYLDNLKPSAYVYAEEYKGDININALENAYNEFYSRCKKRQQLLHNPPGNIEKPT